jgi:hypothetical protein
LCRTKFWKAEDDGFEARREDERRAGALKPCRRTLDPNIFNYTSGFMRIELSIDVKGREGIGR